MGDGLFMTSDKRQGSAWKNNMNKIPYSEQQKVQRTLNVYCGCGRQLFTDEEQDIGICRSCK